jgi:hypothetical protein
VTVPRIARGAEMSRRGSFGILLACFAWFWITASSPAVK